jgi:hypothetical protein
MHNVEIFRLILYFKNIESIEKIRLVIFDFQQLHEVQLM